ncbi:MAG: hypothetical protein ACK4NU_12435 [Brevundimonas sp.]
MPTAPLNVKMDLIMNKKLQTVLVFVVGLVAMVVGYTLLKGM